MPKASHVLEVNAWPCRNKTSGLRGERQARRFQEGCHACSVQRLRGLVKTDPRACHPPSAGGLTHLLGLTAAAGTSL